MFLFRNKKDNSITGSEKRNDILKSKKVKSLFNSQAKQKILFDLEGGIVMGGRREGKLETTDI